MRKLIIPLLMASAFIPASAMAQSRDHDRDRSSAHHDNRDSQRGESRRERSQPTVQAPRSLPNQASDTARERAFGQRGDWQRSDRATQVQSQRRLVGSRYDDRSNRYTQSRGLGGLIGDRNAAEVQRQIDTNARNGGRDGRFGNSRDITIRNGRVVDSHRDDRRGDWRRDGNGNWRDDNHRDWRRDWRGNSRYDWRRYRDSNRFVFRLGTYYDPYRYSYRRYNIGYNLMPNYYSSNFWLNDPWQYRLPPAYGPYRWVRYYDDALLVNIYTGQVADVIYSFFW